MSDPITECGIFFGATKCHLVVVTASWMDVLTSTSPGPISDLSNSHGDGLRVLLVTVFAVEWT
jgi:hypothetical protein